MKRKSTVEWDAKLEYFLFDALCQYPPRSSGLEKLHAHFVALAGRDISLDAVQQHLSSIYDVSMIEDEEGTEDAEEKEKKREKDRGRHTDGPKRDRKSRREDLLNTSTDNSKYNQPVPDAVIDYWLQTLKTNDAGQFANDKRTPPQAYEAIHLAVKAGKLQYAGMPQFVYGSMRELGGIILLQDLYQYLRDNWDRLSDEGAKRYSLTNKTWYSTVRSTLSSFPAIFRRDPSEPAKWGLTVSGDSAAIFASEEELIE